MVTPRRRYLPNASLFAILLSGSGCGPAAGDWSFEAADPADRIRAIRHAVLAADHSGGGAEYIPALVERLEDEDSAVRFFAIGGLYRITGERFGFRASDPIDARRQSVARWRAHLDQSTDHPQVRYLQEVAQLE